MALTDQITDFPHYCAPIFELQSYMSDMIWTFRREVSVCQTK